MRALILALAAALALSACAGTSSRISEPGRTTVRIFGHHDYDLYTVKSNETLVRRQGHAVDLKGYQCDKPEKLHTAASDKGPLIILFCEGDQRYRIQSIAKSADTTVQPTLDAYPRKDNL